MILGRRGIAMMVLSWVLLVAICFGAGVLAYWLSSIL